MSRDQRPRRAVMVDTASDLRNAAPGAGGGADDPALAAVAVAKPRLLLWSMLFLVGCAAGAVAVALLLLGYAP